MKKYVIFLIIFIALFCSCNLNTSTDTDSDIDTSTDTSIEKLTVSFNTNGGTRVLSKKVVYGAVLTDVEIPEKTGYLFDGWYLNGERWVPNNPITSDITLDAKWTLATYSINYVNGYGTIASYTIEDEVELGYKHEEDFIFLGWSRSEDLSNPITKIEKGTTGDITLYAVRAYFPIEFEEKEDGTYEIVGLKNANHNSIQDLTLPSVYKGKPVTSIGDSAFQDLTGITNIIIPSSIKKMGAFAFYSSTIKALEVQEGVEEIGERAFSTSLLKTVELANSIKTIEEGAFGFCKQLENINLPVNLTFLGKEAFNNCSSLNIPLEIPQGVTVIQASTFMRCSNIPSIKLHKGITEIKECAFMFCVGLKEIEIFNGTIEKYALYNCEKLERVILNNGVTQIDERAFALCYALDEIIIPESVQIVHQEAFYMSSTTVYAEAESKPLGWEIDAIWGYKPK